MSRRTIPGTNPAHEVVVGWDAPLRTFFVIVRDLSAEDEEKEMLLWLGAEPGKEIPTPDALAEGCKAYATIDDDTRLRLAADRFVDDGAAPEADADAIADAGLEIAGGDHRRAIEELMAQELAPRRRSPFERIRELLTELG